ncbi:MAG: hypothetical protein PHH84_09135 [Oscillospiraceae bacterium]|nr:hypothetical protein [Oscillospiraceae bacterium]MDD4414133.1 hypothetical protein [Oscillospiraceae bacterium]
MKEDRSNKLTLVVILAAVVAALTTVAVLCLRLRAKRKAFASYGDTIDYDLDDCCCGDYVDEIDDFENESTVQIPKADSQEDIEDLDK